MDECKPLLMGWRSWNAFGNDIDQALMVGRCRLTLSKTRVETAYDVHA